MRASRPILALAFALAAFAGVADVAAARSGGGVVDRRVTFYVVNNNQTGGPGTTDGKAYTIAGRLVGPRGELRRAAAGRDAAATLYLHGLSYGGFFWHLTEFPKYDYATRMARRGHVSVVIDRLGYGRSGKPVGTFDSYAGQATVAHQIVGALRTGAYDIGGRGGRPSFTRIALAGHSASVFVAQLEAYSFNDVDALVLMSLSDVFFSPLAIATFAQTQGVCLGGGDLSDGDSGAPAYAYFGQTDADFQRAHLYNVEPRMRELATAMRTRDPCGESGTALPSIIEDFAATRRIGVPVLLVNGKNDALFPPPAGPLQKSLYSGAHDLTLEQFANTGHALLFGRTADAIRRTVSHWLGTRGF